MNTQAFSKTVYFEGMRAGIPIGLGYFAVSFSLGIFAAKAGVSALQGFFCSLLINASAGEYALFSLMAEHALYIEVLFATLVANARYLLMSFALAQKCSEKMKFYHRLLLGFFITDEFFGITVSRAGTVRPCYTYGAITVASPCWAIGTALGIVAGNLLPAWLVYGLNVTIYGMFLAIIIPAAKGNKVIALFVALAFLCSYGMSVAPVLSDLASGTRVILVTVLLGILAALFFPLPDDRENDSAHASKEKEVLAA